MACYVCKATDMYERNPKVRSQVHKSLEVSVDKMREKSDKLHPSSSSF
jgi:hypothetical protein